LEIDPKKILEWLKLPSTLKGITMLLGLFGVVVTPEHKEAIIGIATMLYGLLAVFYDRN